MIINFYLLKQVIKDVLPAQIKKKETVKGGVSVLQGQNKEITILADLHFNLYIINIIFYIIFYTILLKSDSNTSYLDGYGEPTSKRIETPPAKANR